jgi:class 3 adenylate cyclase
VDSNFKLYDHLASFARIDAILNAPTGTYEETDKLPDRDKLTFANGFYANCTAMFVDIRESSKLPGRYKRPTLARLYRAYISEVVAVMNADPNCREINIVGDGVWCVINTPKKSDIDAAFTTACRINVLIDVLNCKLQKRNIDPIRIGIGLDWGRALMIKAGYSGSGINDVVYMGEVVNSAAHLAALGGKPAGLMYRNPIIMSSVFVHNLNEHNTSLVHWDSQINAYTSNAYITVMQEWLTANCG